MVARLAQGAARLRAVVCVTCRRCRVCPRGWRSSPVLRAGSWSRTTPSAIPS